MEDSERRVQADGAWQTGDGSLKDRDAEFDGALIEAEQPEVQEQAFVSRIALDG